MIYHLYIFILYIYIYTQYIHTYKHVSMASLKKFIDITYMYCEIIYIYISHAPIVPAIIHYPRLYEPLDICFLIHSTYRNPCHFVLRFFPGRVPRFAAPGRGR